ncbi:Hint domain-containing protein [Commensalibacter papalotli (ex Servin-Garciduenas et al. 2014)]|uniref:Outer membrane protein n=1 Tax=Commensalibacter papalotli (ex Servin-Garciduenas et al. 2014) TaxID=1208583 RepID=W7DNR5_9PROT|nr:Hint domain-containing protein [Commensalibacter papalotli (ex Servin-Garciduenas et al. 2014)]EUK18927.1 outer membrane protein [Commensalibacter papalotli (ex Servin-Garciduenas et al. 2014)]
MNDKIISSGNIINTNSDNGNIYLNRATVITGNQYVDQGQIASDTTISSGTQYVSGGRAINTSFYNGSQVISSGGSADGNFFYDGYGYQVVSATDAFVANTSMNSGYQRILGSAINTSIGSGIQVIGGLAYVSNTTIDNGEQDIWGGNVLYTKIGNGKQKDWGAGVVSNTTLISGSQEAGGANYTNNFIDNGFQIIHAGVVSNTSINTGYQIISNGKLDGYLKSTIVVDTQINSGYQTISGGSVTNTRINNGNQYISGGIVSNTNINIGSQIVSAGTVYDTSVNSGAQIIYGGAISGITHLYTNASQVIMSGVYLSGAVVSGSGSQIISSGGAVYNNTMHGITQVISSGAVASGTILDADFSVSSGNSFSYSGDGASQFVLGGGSAYGTIIWVGSQVVSSGAFVDRTVVRNLGSQFISSGAIVENTTLINGGKQFVSSGANISYTTVSLGAVQSVLFGATVDYTNIVSGGSQTVASGAIVYNTSILGSGQGTGRTSQTILSGGIASNTFISGGYQNVGDGATANNTTVTNGAIYAGDGSNLGNITINNGGWLDVSMGTNIKGEVTLNPGGSALITTSNGGVINLVGDTNGGLTIIGEPPLINWEGNDASVTTQIQGFSGTDADHSDSILLEYEDIEFGKLTGVTFPDNDHITITMDTGFSLTLNIVGIKQTGYSIQTPSDGGLGLVLTVCFLSGTEIQTETGVKNIEALQSGDLVTTYDWAKKKYIERVVTWVGQKYCRVNKHLPDDMAGYPVRILKGAIAENVPYKDLLITAEHCLFFEDKFIPVRMLVNGSTIFYDYSITSYEYYHVELEEHSVIIADGMLTESYLDTGNRHAFNHHHKVIETSLCSAKDWTKNAAAPLVVDRGVVEPLYNELKERNSIVKTEYQGRNYKLIEDPDIYLVTDQGVIIRQKRVFNGYVTFMLPSTVQFVWINSRRNRLCDVIGPFIDNRHFLGVLINEIKIYADSALEFIEAHKEQEELLGWHARQEQLGRWTNGKAFLPINSKNLSDNSVLYISMQILAGGPYLEIAQEDEIILAS